MAKVTNINNNKNVIKIDLEESYLDFDLAGKVFNVPLGDEARLKMITAAEEYEQALKKLEDVEVPESDEMTTKEYIALTDRAAELMKVAVDITLGEGAYDYIYSKTKDNIRVVKIFYMVHHEINAYLEQNGSLESDYESQYLKKVTKKK
ncbi:phage tail assembly chaperone [Listeria booriae]|uniref:Phage tail assembly chaperone n=1 Tax=Listeria booriae TaxID=1552123 RepID=A0A7X1DFW9_9LIST|nr:phage tail assembly chaperone [Listeria booriae]MBC1982773.1 phage tail assembly chaperone [Listeria booriae]MBC2004636.1 phage tail assembly chaperone [Listeria booriae]MBC2190538.1 phage tail assembly chaperone [Listeria booriae]MBC2303374.1 phage tail assembly chaperone [Listeria booriae]MBC6163293.1 phage tail assembly chaperone [Listeria booriae]